MILNHSSSTIDKKDFDYIDQLSSTNFVGEGKCIIRLESKLKKYLKKKYCFVVNNGSNALFLALETIKKKSKKKNNEIIVSSYCCPAIINSILQAKLKPIFVDINSHNLNPNLGDVIKNINRKTLGIIISSIGGVTIDLKPLLKFHVPIIEDICQSVGSKINNKLSGNFGNYIIMSFGSTKILTGGIGGAILFNKYNDYKIIKKLITYESLPSIYLKEGFHKSYNMTLSDISAGLILAQFKKLRKFISLRRDIASAYDRILFKKKNINIIKEPDRHFFNRYRYYFLSSNSKNIIKKLRAWGIDARNSLAHNIPNYFKKKQGKFLKININRIVSIPIYPSLKKNELNLIIRALKKI